MKKYVGTKIIEAEPCKAWDRFGNWSIGADGFKVVYPDGYTSWSPVDVFKKAYRPCDALTFGLAIEALKKGLKVARTGWNGKGMWIAMISPAGFQGTNIADAYEMLPSICMKTADEKILVGWLASQTDIFAEDWMIIE
jgi:Protein of unknown function (DUF2829)